MSNAEAPPSGSWSLEVIRDLLTADRLRSYLTRCEQDLDRALQLYEWNLAASAAVMQTTAMLEVVVRNALDVQLVAWAAGRGTASWLDVAPLDHRGLMDIGKACDRATNYGRSSRSHGKVIAELNFGFWRIPHRAAVSREPLGTGNPELLTWVHPDAGVWIAAKSTIPTVLSVKPTPPT